MYIASRHPKLSLPAFRARWRQHGALAMSQPRWVNVKRYVHCDRLEEISLPGLSGDHDGVGMLWYRSPAHRAAHVAATTTQAIMVEDERETFSDLIANSRVLVAEHVVIPGDYAPLKLTQFIWRSEPTSATSFSDRWQQQQAERTESLRGLAERYVVNTPMPPENDKPWGLSCDVIEELWFKDTSAMSTFLRERNELSCDDVTQKTIALATNEVVLYDDM